MEFFNSVKDFQIKNDDFSTVMILRNDSKKTLSLNEDLQENEEYDGTTNHVIFTRIYKMTLKCKFDQHNYPFDYQMCSIMVISISSYYTDSYHKPEKT